MHTLSKREDYAILFLIQLGQFPKTWVTLTDIARNSAIPISVLKQIVVKLKSAGLILSKEGVGGGYKLAKDPTQISCLEIIEAQAGPIHLTSCARNVACQVTRCQIKSVLIRLDQTVTQAFAELSLAALIGGEN